MEFLEIIKALILGIVEGITEWLPVSSTGHLILVDEFIHLDMSDDFKEMFDVVIQLGAILAVVVIYWKQLFPINIKNNPNPLSSHGAGAYLRRDILSMWGKIIVACIPAAVIGILFDDVFNALFYNATSVAIALIVVGIAFIFIEKWNKGRISKINSIDNMNYKIVLIIGLFQLIAAIFPGTSRSGATIIGALLLGVSRKSAAEFTFFLAVPVMAGASLLKLVKYGLSFTGMELAVLAVGMLTAFIVSMLIIRFLMQYIRKHDFTVFGWYRIIYEFNLRRIFMKSCLIVIDFQNDFINGSLGFKKAEELIEPIAEKIKQYRSSNDDIIFTYDTHDKNYAETQEGKKLPVAHCIKNTHGHILNAEIEALRHPSDKCFEKCTFGSDKLFDYLRKTPYKNIELCGLVSNICVISNAVICKTAQPETPIQVDINCTSSFNEKLNKAALAIMESIQIELIGQKEK